MTTASPLSGTRIAVVSRCARTLYNFRKSLAQEARNVGAQVLMVGAETDGFGERLRSDGFEFRHVPVSLRGLDFLGDLRLFFAFVHLFRAFRPEVVHAFTIKPAIYATLAAAIAGVPVRVVTITGLGHSFTTAPAWLKLIVQCLYRLALRYAHVVYFQNQTDRDLFVSQRLVDESRARLVGGSGVDVDRFAPVPLPSAQGAPPAFLMISRLIREKGVAEYITAARVVKSEYPHVQFRLVGGVDLRNPSALSASEVADLQSDGGIDWIGEVDDVRPYIAESDVVVLPSYREGLPRALLEGAAMGRAVIATDTVGCRDVVVPGTTGYLVPVADSDALAAAMVRFIREPAQIKRMGDAGRHRVVQLFDERAVIRQTLQAYEELLALRVNNEKSAAVSRAK